jgi:hypothetical protein
MLHKAKSNAISTRRGKEVRWVRLESPDGVMLDKTIWISVGKLDASWKRRPVEYIGPRGTGPAIGDRYIRFIETLDCVWGEGVGRSQQALMALIKRLRWKMERPGLPDPVETVRGQGLKLSAAILPTFRFSWDKPKVSIQIRNPTSTASQGVELRRSMGQRI